MKASKILIAMLLLVGATALAQEGKVETANPQKNAPAAQNDKSPIFSLSGNGSAAPQSGTVLNSHLTLGGPATDVFHLGKISQLPARLWQLINPFAEVAPKSQIEGLRGTSPVAWTTTAGWRPGSSAFPNATVHEASMNFVSVGVK